MVDGRGEDSNLPAMIGLADTSEFGFLKTRELKKIVELENIALLWKNILVENLERMSLFITLTIINQTIELEI